ncbi:MAG TPA: alpha/beta fold hydrolase [Solirubrobacteraceae bacterium]|nr:alpha/beta fold hydrolase [Solirubrobacteraceae bacterium]
MNGSTKSFRSSDDILISYREWGGEDDPFPPVILHHGFAADAEANWVRPGVVAALVAAGRRVLAPDARGHGGSEKPHDPARYGEERMARDLAGLLDVLGAGQIDLVGYSMGAIVSLILASGEPRVRRLVVGGVGSGVIECGGVDRRAISSEAIIGALTAEDPAGIAEPGAAAFRRLADALGADREALVAQARSIYRGRIALESISAPTLVLAGDADPLAIRPEVLSEAIPDARLQIVGGDHMAAVVDPRFSESIVAFLA